MAERDLEQDSLFKEIDEDLRQEHYAKLWKKYGSIIIAIAVLFVAGVGGQQAWNAYSLNQRTTSSAQLSGAPKARPRPTPTKAAPSIGPPIPPTIGLESEEERLMTDEQRSGVSAPKTIGCRSSHIRRSCGDASGGLRQRCGVGLLNAGRGSVEASFGV